jgi:hypothetical protein
MDAETRHELKTNELAATLVKAKDLIDRYLNTVLVILIVAVLAYTAVRLWSWRHTSALEAGWAEFGKINVEDSTAGDAPLDQLRKIIAEAPDDTLRTAARIRLADALAGSAVDKAMPARVGEAITEFTAIFDSPQSNALFKAAAAFRLAGLHETQRDFAKAAEYYTRLSTDAAFADSPFAKIAAERLLTLDSLKDAVVFTPGSAPPPPPPPSIAPAPAADVPPASAPAEIAPAESPPPQSAPTETP